MVDLGRGSRGALFGVTSRLPPTRTCRVNLQQETVSLAAKKITFVQLIESSFDSPRLPPLTSNCFPPPDRPNRALELSAGPFAPPDSPPYPIFAQTNPNRTRKHSPIRNVRLSPRYNSCWHMPPGSALNLVGHSLPSSPPTRMTHSLRLPQLHSLCRVINSSTGTTTPVLSALSVPSMVLVRNSILHACHCER